MSFEKWEMSHYPSEKDRNRWRLKLKVSEDELPSLVSLLPGSVGRPFLFFEGGFNFGVYLYEMKEDDIPRVQDLLKGKCQNGGVTKTSQEDLLDALLEKVVAGLEDMPTDAASRDNKPAPPPPEKKPEPPSPAAQAEPKESIPARPEPAFVPAEFQDMDLNQNYVFSEFIIGPNNRFTAAAAQAVADNPGKVYNPFFIYSGVGLGKTHLMHAVGHYVHQKNPKARVVYVTTEKFMGEVIDAVRKGTLQQMREHYRQVDLLLVDDIQFLVESESTQEEFFHTFNVLHQNGKQIIITSDRPPKLLTTLEDRLRSRFEWGLIADIKAPNLETRVAILKKKGEIDKLELNDNILLYIASKLKSNIRELEGFLKRISAYAMLTHQPVDMELVKSVMSDLLPEEEQDPEVPPMPAPPAQAAAPRPPEPAAPPPPPPPVAPAVVTPPHPVAPKAPAPAPQPLPMENNDGMKHVEVAFFFPEGKEDELGRVKEHFAEVIKKHKLKFRIDSIFEKSYACSDGIDCRVFAELCRSNSARISIILGPPPESGVENDDFLTRLSAVLDEEHISLQYVPWTELNKDYRYLNLALDITLLKHGG